MGFKGIAKVDMGYVLGCDFILDFRGGEEEECDDEPVVLANLKHDVDENKKIQKQLKKANTSLTHELKESKYRVVKPSLFSADSTLTGGTDSVMCGFTNLIGSDFLVGSIRTVINPDSDLQKIYVPQWNVTNGFRLDDGGVCHEMVYEFAPFKFFASVREMEHDHLFTEFNEAKAAEDIRLPAEASIFKAMEKSLRDEVTTLNGRSIILEKERNALDVKVTDLEAAVVSKERKLIDSNTQLTSIKPQNDNLTDQVHERWVSSFGLKEKLSSYENLTERIEWLLTYGMKLANVKCLNSPEYLSALGTAISKSIEKGMQDRLAAGITHGKEGRVLTDVAAYNPSAEMDYVSALQQL
nr:hypothetical protein [Tanacetum cinerariifolium]